MNKWARPFEWNRAAASTARGTFASPAQQYFAFLSYSHQDSADADSLHRELERFRVPSTLAGRLTEAGVIPRRLTPIFRDRHELAAAHDLGAEIREALEASHCLIVLCSPAAAKSQWTNAEIELFKRLHPDGCVIAAVVAGEPFASEIKGREKEECLPPALRQKYDRRGRPTGRRAEPLAADLRESGDGRRLGFLKIVAGMLGVGLDDLVQRDQMRRQRRMATIAIASLLGMLVAIILAVTAINARDAARDERREAEGLVAFMLGDLKDKLQPIGRLDALDGVGARVLQYYQKQDTSEYSDAALLQRSKALSLMAEVAYARGNADAASALYREAMVGTEEAVNRSPDDPKRLFEHAQNVFWVGEIARRRGQFAPAEAAYREYKRLADRMVALEPDNLRWRMEVLYANENLGIALYDERRFGDATRQFETTIRPMQSAAAIDSGNNTYQIEFANLLAWLSKSRAAEGQLEQAIAARQNQIAVLERISGTTDVRLQEKLLTARQSLGLLFASRGHDGQALAELQTAVSAADRLVQLESQNQLWKRYAAATRLDLGKTLLANGDASAASRAGSSGCEITASLRGRDPNVDKWRKLQTDCLALRARLALAAGSLAEAGALAGQAVATAREGTGDPTSDAYVLAAAYRLQGDIFRGGGNASRAEMAWSSGLSAIRANVTEQPWETSEREQLLRRLGREAEARPLSARLRSIGYRQSI